MKKLFSEFKEFINRGNVMDLAVAVIIGGAFGAGDKGGAKLRGHCTQIKRRLDARPVHNPARCNDWKALLGDKQANKLRRS